MHRLCSPHRTQTPHTPTLLRNTLRDASELIAKTLRSFEGKADDAQIDRALDVIATAVSEQQLTSQVELHRNSRNAHPSDPLSITTMRLFV